MIISGRDRDHVGDCSGDIALQKRIVPENDHRSVLLECQAVTLSGGHGLHFGERAGDRALGDPALPHATTVPLLFKARLCAPPAAT